MPACELLIILVPQPQLVEISQLLWVFPVSSYGRESACNAGDLDLIPGLGRSPGEGNGYSLQYS